VRYKIKSPVYSGVIETRIEENAVMSRVSVDGKCEVVHVVDSPTCPFSGWWAENVKKYCLLRGWEIEAQIS
jgi:hypothetical protein